jgi:hypothetical protein
MGGSYEAGRASSMTEDFFRKDCPEVGNARRLEFSWVSGILRIAD